VHHANTTLLTFTKKKPNQGKKRATKYQLMMQKMHIKGKSQGQIKSQDQDTWVEKHLPCCNITEKLNENLGCSN
jgi:hypothetical protein